jgi:hypothetical protein
MTFPIFNISTSSLLLDIELQTDKARIELKKKEIEYIDDRLCDDEHDERREYEEILSLARLAILLCHR